MSIKNALSPVDARWKKDKRTNNDMQTPTQKTKDRATQTPLEPGGELCVNSTCFNSGNRWLLIGKYFQTDILTLL
jgi:hypothetical protein